MNSKTVLILFAATLIVLTAIPAARSFPQFQLAAQRHAQLEKSNAALQKKLAKIQTELRAASTEDAKFSNNIESSLADADSIPVKLELIKQLNFDILEGQPHNTPPPTDLKLTVQAAGVLALSAEEAASIQSVFSELQSHLEAYQRANIKQITLEQTTEHHLFEFMSSLAKWANWGPINIQVEDPSDLPPLKNTPRLKTAYEIPAMDEATWADLQKWLANSVTNAIGPDRADILLQRIKKEWKFWPDKNQYMLIAFLDQGDPSVGASRTEWAEAILFNDSEDATGMGGTSADSVPPHLAFLFQPVTDDSTIRRKIISP